MYCKLPFGIKAVRSCALTILVIVLFGYKGFAQSLGDPIINITFGSGIANKAGPLPADSGSTTYFYQAGTFPNDGFYTIANTTAGMLTGWWVTTDHTGNPGGYMMVVNANYQPGIFYTRTVAGLCGSTKYQFAAWIKNLLNYDGILPNVTFSIETKNGTVLGTGNTGDIQKGDVWVQYPFTFSTPAGTDTVVLKMTNNAPGGNGNDIAIDDITFRPYGAQITTLINNKATSQTFCAGSPQHLTINVTSKLATGYVQKLQQLVNGVWTDQTAADTISKFNLTSPSAVGTYSYRVASAEAIYINSSRCVVNSTPVILTVAPPPTATFSASATTCFGDSTAFTDKSTTTGTTVTGWLWDFGDGQTSAKQNPKHLFATAGNHTVQLTITNGNGCTATTSQTVHITVAPQPAFSVSSPDCVTNTITLTDQSTSAEGSVASWVWDYGDKTTETKTSAAPFQHTYAATGTYTIKLTVTSSIGCTATTTKAVTINPLPVVNFVTPDVCLADGSAQFTDSTTIAGNSNNFTYRWNFGDPNATLANPNFSTAKNPQHHYSAAAVYKVTLKVTSVNGCVDSLTKNFTVNGSIPKAGFKVLNPADLCSDHEVFFVNQSSVDFGSITKIEIYYDWLNNPTVFETDNSPTPGKLYRHTYPTFHSPATKTCVVHVLAYSGISCVNPYDLTITLLATPALTFTSPFSVCLNEQPFQLTAAETSGIAGSGAYTGTGVTSGGLFNPAGAGVGTYKITYIFTATNACADTVTTSINVKPIPTVYAGPNITILQGGTASMNATASGDSLTYAWLPTTGLSDPTVLNPIVSAVADVTYTLTATNKEGCSISSQVTVSVLKAPVIPNTFTPNNDGVNDTWNIKYLDTYTDCTVEIFNRYGQKVFASIGYPVPWDGRSNGSDLPAGVYYYIINPKHGRSIISGWVAIVR